MTHRFIPAVLCVFVVLFPLVSAAHDPAERAKTGSARIPAAAQPAVEVVDQFSAALGAGQLEQAGALLVEDVLILESGGAERSREEYLAGHAGADAAFLEGAGIQLLNRNASISGDLAWVGSESEVQVMGSNGPMTLLSTETMVLERRTEGWRIAHIHWSSRPKKEEG